MDPTTILIRSVFSVWQRRNHAPTLHHSPSCNLLQCNKRLGSVRGCWKVFVHKNGENITLKCYFVVDKGTTMDCHTLRWHSSLWLWFSSRLPSVWEASGSFTNPRKRMDRQEPSHVSKKSFRLTSQLRTTMNILTIDTRSWLLFALVLMDESVNFSKGATCVSGLLCGIQKTALNALCPVQPMYAECNVSWILCVPCWQNFLCCKFVGANPRNVPEQNVFSRRNCISSCEYSCLCVNYQKYMHACTAELWFLFTPFELFQ